MMFLRHPVSKYLDGRLAEPARDRFERHLRHCRACAVAVEQDQELKERLRSASVPEPSSGLADRILSRNTGAAGNPHAPAPRLPVSGASTVRGRLLAAAGSLTVVVLASISGVYVMGHSVASSMATTELSLQQADAWNESAIERADLNDLRSAGWNCPELAVLGFHVDSARGYRLDGVPTVELTLRRGESFITVYEQRVHSGEYPPSAPQPVINAATGHSAAEDGFVRLDLGAIETGAIEGSSIAAGSEASSAGMWFRHGEQWQIIVVLGNANYTVSSDLPVMEVATAAAQVAAAERARLSTGADQAAQRGKSRELFERIWHGVLAPVAWNI